MNSFKTIPGITPISRKEWVDNLKAEQKPNQKQIQMFTAFWGMEYWKAKARGNQDELNALGAVLTAVCEKYELDIENILDYCEVTMEYPVAIEQTALFDDFDSIIKNGYWQYWKP